MKKIIIATFILYFTVYPQIKIINGSDLCAQKRQSRSNSIMNRNITPRQHHSFDVLHYKLDLDLYKNFGTVDPSVKTFTGSVTITARIDSTLDNLKLDAVNTSLKIDSVVMSGKSFVHYNDVLSIQLDTIHSPGDTVTVKVYYQHKDIADGGFFSGTDGMVMTDSEPERARCWFPCWDKPSDKATTELYAKVPSSVLLGSNGRLADTVRTGDTIVYHWISRDPMSTYLVSFTARLEYHLDIVYWKRPSNQNDSIPFYFYWSSKVSQSGLKQIKTDIIPMADFYSALFGEHPFEKNGFAGTTYSPWAGMENQTLTNINSSLWGFKSLFVHEFAHQWFGDMITCGTWADIWLNEGFATYIEALWLEHTVSYNAYKDQLRQNAEYDYWPYNPGWPIYNPEWAIHTPSNDTLFNSKIIYNKASIVLHILRYVLGDSVFFSSIRSYATNPKYRMGNATTDDFIDAINTTSKRDLTWFFDEWIKTGNHPLYKTEYSVNQNDSTAIVNISQTQTWPGFWKMPIEIKFILSGGRDTVVTVFNSVNGETFKFKFNDKPISMIFDYQNNIILKTSSTKLVLDVSSFHKIPFQFGLEQNFPNPFNPNTTIKFSIPKASNVILKVYDAIGREVATIVSEYLTAGNHVRQWSALNTTSGIYFYRLQADNFVETKKLVLLK